MHRSIRLTLAAAALAALSPPLIAGDEAGTERAFAAAARSFNDCLFAAAQAGEPLAGRCLVQETGFRENALRLRLSRGQGEQAAALAVEADVIAGRRMAMGSQPQRYALAR